MATFISHSPAETEALGEQWGRAAATGLVISLTGDLGAGKTRLVKGLARGLGIPERVHSPTFTLVNVYAGGRLTLFHLDLYRLETREHIVGAGLEVYLRPPGVAVVEWAERWDEIRGRMPEVQNPDTTTDSRKPSPFSPRVTLRRVQIEVLNETERRITYEDIGD
jgi:tRNA threonylcarbamoyladenosine biosynthesis protein TsaE